MCAMPVEYVPVSEEEGDDPIEVPTEPDGTLLLSTLTAQFPGVTGLRYRNPETSGLRAVRLVNGALLQPPELNSWSHNGNVVYLCSFPKDNKRKVEHDEPEGLSSKPKKADRKKCTDLIVLGLPYRVTEEDLKNYFEKFGELVMTQIKRDQQGGSRGYGFIRFSEYESQLECLSSFKHQIEGRLCEVKVPNSQGDSAQPISIPRRVFVGRITEDLTPSVLKDFFGQYGNVEEVYIPKPFRSFAFVTFSDSNVVSRLVGEDFVVNGVSVHVGHANPKQQQQQQPHGHGIAQMMLPSPQQQPFKPMNPQFMQGPAPQQPMGASGWQQQQPPPPPQQQYQDMVNTLASNPQILAAALAQVSSMSMDGGQQQQQQRGRRSGGNFGGGRSNLQAGASADANGGAYSGLGGYGGYNW